VGAPWWLGGTLGASLSGMVKMLFVGACALALAGCGGNAFEAGNAAEESDAAPDARGDKGVGPGEASVATDGAEVDSGGDGALCAYGVPCGTCGPIGSTCSRPDAAVTIDVIYCPAGLEPTGGCPHLNAQPYLYCCPAAR